MSSFNSKCENKIDIPFERQERQIYSINDISFNNYPLGKLDLSYNDPTTLQIQKFKNAPMLELKIKGNTAIDICGTICDISENQLVMKGTLKLEKNISGPYRTEGGIIRFQRLFLHFDNLVIPIELKYSYDINKICDPSFNILKDTSGIDVSLDVSRNAILFDKFFVSNSLFEMNRNEIFTGLVDQFRDTNGTFNEVYKNFLSSLKGTDIFMMTIQELNRIICLTKNKENNKEPQKIKAQPSFDDEEYLLPASRYKEKIARLKDKGYLELIFK